jgi:hypothetical protein
MNTLIGFSWETAKKNSKVFLCVCAEEIFLTLKVSQEVFLGQWKKIIQFFSKYIF